jgi:hypothetical protein
LYFIVKQKQSLTASFDVGLVGMFAPAIAQVMDIRPDGSTAASKSRVTTSPEAVEPSKEKITSVRPATPVRAAITSAAAAHLQAC